MLGDLAVVVGGGVALGCAWRIGQWEDLEKPDRGEEGTVVETSRPSKVQVQEIEVFTCVKLLMYFFKN